MQAVSATKLLEQYMSAYEAERAIAQAPASLFNDRALELIRAAQKVRTDIRAAFGVTPDDVEAEVQFDRTLGLSMLARS